MTISLSNQSNTRKIGLKPIETHSNDLFHEGETIEDTKESIRKKLHQAEQKLKDAQSQAEEMLKQSKLQIEEEKTLWESQREVHRKQAYEDGYQEGFQKGVTEANEEYKVAIQSAQETIDLAKAEYLNIINQSEETILALGVKIASKITRLFYQDKPEAFVELVKQAIQEIEDQPQIKLFVHPKYYSFVIEQKDELLAIVNSKAELVIYPHEELNFEDCYLESSIGRIDASVDSQLLQIRERLFELLEEEKG